MYAEIKEEMKSYFATGVVDDTMFPIYTESALKKIGRATYKIDEVIVELSNLSACLPADFSFIREVWSCQSSYFTMPNPGALYSSNTYVISPGGDFDSCNPCSCPETCDKKFQVVSKTTTQTILTFNHSYRLKPGNRNVLNLCSKDCDAISKDAPDIFDIRDGKIFTGFTEGTLHIIFYKKEFDDSEFQLIPDNHRIIEYIKAFLKYKMYEQIFNEVADESFNQAERKYQLYKQEYYDAYINADAEVKKQTIGQKISSIHAASRRMNKYIIR